MAMMNDVNAAAADDNDDLSNDICSAGCS